MVILLLALGSAGCDATPMGGQGLPDPDLSDMEPQVADVLRHKRQIVVERGSVESWGDLGAAYDAHGLLEQAESCYRRAHELDPRGFEWAYLLAVVREVRGAETQEVVELFDRAARLRPDYGPVFVRLGAALALRGEHSDAREAFENAIALAPRNAVAHRGLGQTMLALGNAGTAAEHLERAVELEPRDLSARSSLAQAYMRSGRAELAAELVRQAQQLQPINSFDDAVYAERVFLRSVGSSRAYARAQAALRTGRFDQAVRDLTIVVEARPDDASAHYWKGMAHRRLGQGDPASTHLSRAVALEPTLVQARLELGALELSRARHAQAVEQLEAAGALQPLDADGHFGLGLAYEGAGDLAQARVHFEAAACLDPEHPAAARLSQSPM
jgi:Flp pilus assembly protein TadD